MSDIRVIALNGPPGSGKDTVADWLTALEEPIFHKTTFSLPLKLAHNAILNIADWEVNTIDKDVPLPILNHQYTLREFDILLAEEFLKTHFGKDILVRLWFARLANYRPDISAIHIICGVGFEEELQPLIDFFGAEAILIIQLEREGCSFDGDSRSYIYGAENCGATIANNSSKEDLFKEVRNVLHFQGINLPT